MVSLKLLVEHLCDRSRADDEESTFGKTIDVEFVGIEQNKPVVMRKLIHGIIIGCIRLTLLIGFDWGSGSVRCNLGEPNILAAYGNDMGITNYGLRLKDEAIKKLKERTQMSKKRLKIWDPGIKIVSRQHLEGKAVLEKSFYKDRLTLQGQHPLPIVGANDMERHALNVFTMKLLG
ncbi:hypothetical protein Tco_0045036 [Tanacetum coccineum]